MLMKGADNEKPEIPENLREFSEKEIVQIAIELIEFFLSQDTNEQIKDLEKAEESSTD